MTPGAGPVAVILLGASLALTGSGAAVASTAPTPVPSPTLIYGSQVDPNSAATLPVEDVMGPVEDLVTGAEALVFAEASVDGAVTDRGGREFSLASDVLFAFNKATLTERARTEIIRIAKALRTPAQTGDRAGAGITAVSVTGFTDNVGSDRFNLGLSRRRAAAVRAELVTALGATTTVTALGRGEHDPVATNRTGRGRQANRRVEIRGR